MAEHQGLSSLGLHGGVRNLCALRSGPPPLSFSEDLGLPEPQVALPQEPDHSGANATYWQPVPL